MSLTNEQAMRRPHIDQHDNHKEITNELHAL